MNLRGHYLKHRLLASTVMLLGCSWASGQTVAVDAESTANATGGFAVISISGDLQMSYDEFREHSGQKQWNRALAALARLMEADPAKMLAAGGGFHVPCRRRLWQDIVNLPAAGKDAFRIFHNAKAGHLLDQASAQAGRDEELKLLGRIHEQFFVTAVGDVATDRLGDALFERGRFHEAARCWQTILDHRPDSDLSPLRLHVKRAEALARVSAWARLDRTLSIVANRYAGQSVTLGGRRVSAEARLDQLAGQRRQPAAATTTPKPAGRIRLPRKRTATWQFRFVDDATRKALRSNRENWRGMLIAVDSFVPASAVDDQRVYVNWLGVVVAFDRVTGKIAWSHGKFIDVAKRIGDQAHVVAPARYQLIAGAGRVFTVAAAASQVARQDAQFRLFSTEASSGKRRWSSDRVEALKVYSFVGAPALKDDLLLAVAHE